MLYPGWANDVDEDEEIDRNFRHRMSSASTWSLNTLETVEDQEEKNRGMLSIPEERWPRDVSARSSVSRVEESGAGENVPRTGQNERLKVAIMKLEAISR
jgi:hypothetical protein